MTTFVLIATRREAFWLYVFCSGMQFAVLGPRASAQSSALPNGQYRPFTAQLKTTYVDEQGGETVFLGTFFRKGDGSFARIQDNDGPGGMRGTGRDIVDFPRRVWISTEPFAKTVMVVARDEAGFNELLTVLAGNCENFVGGAWKQIGEFPMFGVRAVEFEDNPSTNLSMRTVVAPELACFPLLNLFIENGDLRTKTEVLSLKFGEPDPSAFLVPPGYKQVSPLEREDLWEKTYGEHSYIGRDRSRLLEREYQEGRARLANSPNQ